MSCSLPPREPSRPLPALAQGLPPQGPGQPLVPQEAWLQCALCCARGGTKRSVRQSEAGLRPETAGRDHGLSDRTRSRDRGLPGCRPPPPQSSQPGPHLLICRSTPLVSQGFSLLESCLPSTKPCWSYVQSPEDQVCGADECYQEGP